MKLIRIFALVLALAAVFTSVPTVFAADDAKAAETTVSSKFDVFEDFDVRELMRSETGMLILSYSEAYRIAAHLHSLYHTGKEDFDDPEVMWIDEEYRDYLIKNKVIKQSFTKNTDIKVITRADLAFLLANVFDDDGYEEINDIKDGDIPDVRIKEKSKYKYGTYTGNSTLFGGEYVYKLYRAGIIVGYEQDPTFIGTHIIRDKKVDSAPFDGTFFYDDRVITYNEIIEIIDRMINPEKRLRFSLDKDKMYLNAYAAKMEELTAANTDAPTDAQGESAYMPPEDWAVNEYALVCIDNDDIPELIHVERAYFGGGIRSTVKTGQRDYSIYTYEDGEVKLYTEFEEYGDIAYIPYGNGYLVHDGFYTVMGCYYDEYSHKLFSGKNKKLSVKTTISIEDDRQYEKITYTVDGKKVYKSALQNALLKLPASCEPVYINESYDIFGYVIPEIETEKSYLKAYANKLEELYDYAKKKNDVHSPRKYSLINIDGDSVPELLYLRSSGSGGWCTTSMVFDLYSYEKNKVVLKKSFTVNDFMLDSDNYDLYYKPGEQMLAAANISQNTDEGIMLNVFWEIIDISEKKPKVSELFEYYLYVSDADSEYRWSGDYETANDLNKAAKASLKGFMKINFINDIDLLYYPNTNYHTSVNNFDIIDFMDTVSELVY